MERKEQLLAITHLGDEYEKYLGAVVPPVFLNSLHIFPTHERYMNADPLGEEYIYGRVSNPTVRLLERKLAAIEGGSQAAVFASGMAAATSAILTVCKAGDHIVSMRDVYGPIKRFMTGMGTPRLNIGISYVGGQDLGELERAIQPNTRLIILESPATFVFSVVDLRAIADIARRRGVKTYIDNTYSTPLFQNPLELGIDIVMHTLSKYIGGHSDVIGGALVSKDAELIRDVYQHAREWFGGIMGPMEAWLVIRGLRTLDARLCRHQDSALRVAQYLEKHLKVRKVYYTGLASHPQAGLIAAQMRGHTGLMSLELDAPAEKALSFVDGLRLFGKGCSWGGFESLAICPLYQASSEEMAFLGLRERGLIRLHVGLEGADSLLEDLDAALRGV